MEEFNSSEREKVLEDETNRNNGDSDGSYIRLESLPPGFIFNPSDEELLLYYLQPKMNNLKLPPNLMHEIDLYDPNSLEENSPVQLTRRYEAQGEGEWYFFTSRHRLFPNGCRPSRSSGVGFWKSVGKDEEICLNGENIGYKQTLVFYDGKHPHSRKTNWLMKEYKLFHDNTKTVTRPKKFVKPPKSTRVKLDDWVLCKIYNRNRASIMEKGNNQENYGIEADVLEANNNNGECLRLSTAIPDNNMISSVFELGSSSGSNSENDNNADKVIMDTDFVIDFSFLKDISVPADYKDNFLNAFHGAFDPSSIDDRHPW